MGLIDLKTDLKSLRYGKDTIGGGYSGQPYIQTPIPDSFNNLGPREDFILRGGVNAIGDAVTDVRRLTKMFFDLKSPNGLIFIAKQNLLSQAAVRTQTTTDVNEGIYTPLNTLAQAGIVELGGHLNKQGVNPFEETGAYANSEILYSVKVKNNQSVETNRLARLYQAVQTNTGEKLDGFILNNGPQNILTYNGGPNSILGAGQTNIRYSTFRTGNQNPKSVSNPDFFTGKNNQKSVNTEDKQVGGLQINPNKLWTKSPTYGLPDFTPNTPQTSSFVQSRNGQYNYDSSLAKQNISGSLEGGKYDFYNPLRYAGISANESIYNTLLGVYEVESTLRDNEGNTLWWNNVYQSGSLKVYEPNVGASTWTPKADTEKYNPISGRNISNIYSTRANINLFPSDYFNEITGQKLKSNSVYNISITPEGPEYLTPFEAPPGPNTPPNQGASSIYANGAITYNQEDLISSDPSRYSPSIKEDFRKVLRSKIPNQTVAEGYEQTGNIVPLAYISYTDKNIGVKNLLGNPGNTKIKNLSNFSNGTGNILTRDQINASEPGTDLSSSDLVPFKITNIQSGQVLTFRAFLGGITDSYSATINSQQYVGRGENFYTYGGQTRKISLSWTVASLSKEELLPMYRRLNALAGNTAPKYVDGFMQGPLVKMTIGGYITELPGYIEGFTLDMAEDSTWEIGINPDGTKNSATSQLTHVIKVSGFNFTPIPTYLPQVGAPFISISSPS